MEIPNHLCTRITERIMERIREHLKETFDVGPPPNIHHWNRTYEAIYKELAEHLPKR